MIYNYFVYVTKLPYFNTNVSMKLQSQFLILVYCCKCVNALCVGKTMELNTTHYTQLKKNIVAPLAGTIRLKQTRRQFDGIWVIFSSTTTHCSAGASYFALSVYNIEFTCVEHIYRMFVPFWCVRFCDTFNHTLLM